MKTATANQIREYVNKALIEPARRSGGMHAVVVAGEVHRSMKLDNRMPAVCSALDAQRFQRDYRVQLSKRSGPRQGSTATWRFSVLR